MFFEAVYICLSTPGRGGTPLSPNEQTGGGHTFPRAQPPTPKKPFPLAVDRRRVDYLTSTWAPTSSNFFLIAAASSLETPSLTTLGAPSTRSLASLRPRLVTSRTTLITLIFLSPVLMRWTANSVCSSATAAAPPPAAAPPAAAIITGAAAA